MVEFRKLISFGKTSYVMSIPKSWVQKNNLKKGDLVALDEKDGNLVLNPKVDISSESHKKKIEIDITGIDRTSILYSIRSAYKRGFDEIKLVYNSPLSKHFRIEKEEKVISIIHEEVNRLVGIEVIKQKENFCIIKDLSEPTSSEFDSALRRVLLLMNDAASEIVVSIKDNDLISLETVEEKHDSVTKFISYCLRLINKGKYSDVSKGMLLYHIISNLDKVTDVLKYSSRSIRELNKKLSKDTVDIMKMILSSIEDYYDLFYKFDFNKSSKMYKNRDECLKSITNMRKKVSPEELLILEKTASILELITDLSEARMGLEHD